MRIRGERMEEKFAKLLENARADRSPGYVEETLESAGCTGQCESFKDGLPDCERCSQWAEGM